MSGSDVEGIQDLSKESTAALCSSLHRIDVIIKVLVQQFPASLSGCRWSQHGQSEGVDSIGDFGVL